MRRPNSGISRAASSTWSSSRARTSTTATSSSTSARSEERRVGKECRARRRRHTRYIGDWSSDVCSSDLDGVDNNQTSDNLSSYQPNLDAIAEFKMITNNASAEFGNFQGGIINVVIKSGTNQYHGNVFEYFRKIGRASCRERVSSQEKTAYEIHR